MTITTTNKYIEPLFDMIAEDEYSPLNDYGINAGIYSQYMGQFDAQNAFGVHVTATKRLLYTDDILLKSNSGRSPGITFGTVTFTVPPEQAKAAIDNLEIAVAGHLRAPFARRYVKTTQAKIDYPYETENREKIVFVTPICAWLPIDFATTRRDRIGNISA